MKTRTTASVLINISSMVTMKQYHDFLVIINFISNSVIADSDALLVFKSF